MSEHSSAQADLARLWGDGHTAKFGPKGRLTAREVARIAIGLADEGGLEALSMRSMAKVLGMSPMGLYTYFPGKSEIIELMVDEIYSKLPLSFEEGGDWRARLTFVARSNWDLLMRHPWLVDIEGHRPVLGPNVIAKYNFELSAIEGIGLSDLTMDLVLSVLLNFVRGAAKSKLDAIAVSQRTGQTDAVWWELRGPLLGELLKGEYPIAQRIGAAVGAQNNSSGDPVIAFEFGIERLLDGVAGLKF